MGGERHSASAHRASWKTCGGARPLGLCTSVDFDQVILDNFWELGCASSASCPGQNGCQSVAVRLCAHGAERVACRNPVGQIWHHQPPGTLESRREACPKVHQTESQITTRGAAKSVFGNEWHGARKQERASIAVARLLGHGGDVGCVERACQRPRPRPTYPRSPSKLECDCRDPKACVRNYTAGRCYNPRPSTVEAWRRGNRYREAV